MPKLSIVIVSWNVCALLKKLLFSLFHYLPTEVEVIVIDNASSDDTAKMLTTEFSQFIASGRLITVLNEDNRGFSRANNQGLNLAKGEFVLFMNPDMQIRDGRLFSLLDLFVADKSIGAVSCRLLNPDLTLQRNIKNDPSLRDQLLILLKAHHFLKFLPCLKKYFHKNFDYNKTQTVEQAMGAFLMMPTGLARSLGGWDENYWLWWEDVALCSAIRQSGKSILYSPDAEVIHYEGASFSQWWGLAKQKRFNKGLLTYFSTHRPKWQVYIIKAFIPLSLLLTVLTLFFKVKPRPQSKS